jgi:PAS domain S-box-containing protein
MTPHLPMSKTTRHFAWALTIALGTVMAYGQAPAPAQDRIVVGVNKDYPPYEFTDSAGNPTGFDVDVVRAAARMVYIKADIQAGQWSDIRAKLETKRIDLLAGMLYSSDRAKSVEFGAPYLLVEYGLFTRKGGPRITDVKDLANKSVLVEDGSQMHDHLKQTSVASIIPTSSEPEALRKLAEGKGDAAMLPLLEGLLLIQEEKLSNIDVVEGVGFSRNLSFAASKGNHDLVGRLNTGLAIIKANGEYHQIYEKWFGSITKTPSKWPGIVLWLISGIGLISALATAWVTTLRRQVRERTRRLDEELAERRRIEADLRISEQMYRSLVEQAADGIFLADENLNLIDVNEAGCAMFRMTKEELVGRPVSSLFEPDHLSQKPMPTDRLHGGELVINERRAIRKDGTVFDVESSAKLTAPGVFQGVLRDITEHKLNMSNLRRSNEELELRVQERTGELESFSYSVAHDLRSPLRAMDGYASILLLEESDHLSDEAKRYLQRISANSRRMGILIDTLLEYARLGRNPLKISSLDIGALTRNEWEELEAERWPREIDFQVHPIPPLDGDETLVKLALQNLLKNSIKFTRGCEAAKIEVGYVPEQKAVFVRDNGAGFDQRYVNKLFGVFERLHSDEYEGTGVGLATVSRIVNRHGGEIWAEGVVGEGATFWFTLGSSKGSRIR